MNKENFIGYEKALTDNEILEYSLLIDRFRTEEIDYPSLEAEFLNKGIIVSPIIDADPNNLKLAIEAELMKKRLAEKKYLYNDIRCFILNNKDFKNVVFRIDRKAIELLANQGIPDYQIKLIWILKTQLNHSSDTDEETTMERLKWRRRIAELQLELSKNDKPSNTR